MSAIRLARGVTGRAEGRQVRRLLPRPRRRAARLGRQRPGDLRAAGQPRRHRRLRRRHHRRPLQRPAPPLEAVFAEHGDQIACVITEAAPGNMGVVPPCPASPRACAGSPAAHGALLVSDEVMTGFRCSALRLVRARGSVRRRRAGPVHLRQGDGRRLPRGRVRRPGRRDGPARAAGPGLPGGHAVREPGRDRRRAGDAAGLHGRRLRPDPVVADTIADARVEGARPRPACRTSCSTRAACSACSSPTSRCATTTTRAHPGRRCVPRLLPRDAARGRAPAAQRLRGLVRLRRARRRRASSACSPRCPAAARAAAEAPDRPPKGPPGEPAHRRPPPAAR